MSHDDNLSIPPPPAMPAVQIIDPGAAPVDPSVYAALAAPFDHTFTDNRGGVTLTYITGEQVLTRLNEVLGVDGWGFRVLKHGIHVEADEVWALGELVAIMGGRLVSRQQFGSNKLKRSRQTGAPLDIGFDLKAAGTDALKKCATGLGVGLYLSKKATQGPPPARVTGGGGYRN